MRNTLKTILVLGVAVLLMLLFRAVVLTVCCIEGDALHPVFLAGDRVLVNRWSYGLRVGDNRLFCYNRLWRSPVDRGDIVAVNDPTDSLQPSVENRRVLFLRCKYVPGDRVSRNGQPYQMPGRSSCADMDYYLMESVSGNPAAKGRKAGETVLIPEDHIIGRAYLIIYSQDPSQPIWDGWRTDRLFVYP